MRVVFLVIGLLALGACAQPAPSPMAQNGTPKSDKSDLNRFVEPTNGAAYSQGDMYYYRENSSTSFQGPAGNAFKAK
jgi:hypothetical protein